MNENHFYKLIKKTFNKNKLITNIYLLLSFIFLFSTIFIYYKKSKFIVYQGNELIKKNNVIKNQERKLVFFKNLSKYTLEHDLDIKNNLKNLEYESSNFFLDYSSNKILLKKFNPKGTALLRGINKDLPVSAYLDTDGENLFLLSSVGVIAYSKENDSKIIFKQIKNNLNKYLSKKELQKGNWFSFKDLLIVKNKIYVSYTNELSEDCWSLNVLEAELNFDKIIFDHIFLTKECINSKNNIDNEFNAHQSGGRIFKYDKDNILISTGDFRQRNLSQDPKSPHGKILKINLKNKKFKIISMGNRNIQGLYLDKFNKVIISTEHGPKGGDEINILKITSLKENSIANYGWPISSYGEHYIKDKKPKEIVEKLYIKYPLHKSHAEHGFIEPIKYYVPSIGISEITAIDETKKLYLHGSMKKGQLYLIKLDENFQVIDSRNLYLGERIRDIVKFNNKIYLFLETTGSIGILNASDIDI